MLGLYTPKESLGNLEKLFSPFGLQFSGRAVFIFCLKVSTRAAIRLDVCMYLVKYHKDISLNTELTIILL